MKAREIMSHPVISVRTTTPVLEAIELLARMQFTAVPVLDDDGRLVGIVTELDLIRERMPTDPRLHPEVFAPPHLPRTVAGVMSSPVESLTSGADVADAARMMSDERIRSVPIVNGLEVVGIITRRDLLRALAHDDQGLTTQIIDMLRTIEDSDRWVVSVRAGVADISDLRNRPDDLARARVLAAKVPGVVAALAHHQSPDPF